MKQATQVVQAGKALAYRVTRTYEGTASAQTLVRNLIRAHTE